MRGSACVVLFVALASGDALAQQPEPAPPPSPPPSDPPTEPVVEPTPEPTPTPVAPDPKPPAVEPSKPNPDAPVETPMTITGPSDRGFRFGSYGRVIAGTDLRGGKPESANVVAFGPRIVEPSYLELDFSYGFDTPRGYVLRPVITLAFDGTLFHETGEFDAQPALRNMYLDAQLTKRTTAWVGSRMYRGDDIYLFDYWPLDDQNTVGGGVMYRRSEAPSGGDTLEVAAHAGVNRLLNQFQFQENDVPDPEQGAVTVVQLNRQRMVMSGSVAYILAGNNNTNLKAKLHSEFHALPSGTRKRVDGTFESLPADSGYVLGAQLGAFGFASPSSKYRRHANVFLRYAKGLAAFDELAPPTSFGSNLKTQRASELSFGLSANWDTKFGYLQAGALSRRFIDSDAAGADYDDAWEYAIAVRPLARTPGIPELFLGGELSYQARFPKGLNPTTQRAQDPSVFQIAPMIVFSPMGPSGYDRPQLRLVYRAAFLNQAAQDLFVPGDPRAKESVTHFLGFQAEWWFNSSTYR
ncbi:MAG: carbohydrate porin [Myxococcota bacterium]|nr:carbohydrate porin [Myxococcota bacterium]